MDDIDRIITSIEQENARPTEVDSVIEELLDVHQNALNITQVSAEDMEEDVNEEQEEIISASEPVSDTIRPNSPTLLIDESTSRFSSAIWAEAIRNQTVTLAGLGGIGSYVGFLLSRVKPERIIIYDPDMIESVNMSGQLYSRSVIGSFKASALVSFMMDYSGYYNIYANNQRFTSRCPSTNIMICGFDNMSARKTFYEVWKESVINEQEEEKAKCLFIDGRLAAEEFQVFCIKGDDLYHMKKYEEEWLFSDEEAEMTMCSYKQTSHCASMIASVMVNLFVNFIANQCEPLVDRDLPFLTSYDASTMYFKTVS